MIPVYATRPDGWPLCPMCHEQAWVDHGLRCYRCDWSSTESPAVTRSKGVVMEPIRVWDMADPNGKDVTRVMLFDRQTGEWTDITAFVLSMEITMHDHYPLQHLPQCARCGEHERPGTLHICVDVVAQLNTPPPIVAPFVPAVAAPTPAPQRFAKFGDSMVCLTCNLDARYCRGHSPSPSPSGGDGIDSDLNRRVRELRGRDNR